MAVGCVGKWLGCRSSTGGLSLPCARSMVDFVGKLSAVGQPTRPALPSIPRRSDVNSLLQTLHWLPVEQRSNYKLAVLTFKTQQTSSPQYLNQHISLRTSALTQHSIVVRPTAVRAISTDIICQTIFQHCRTSD